MALPILLTLIRHGISEGNVAAHASKRGDDSYFTPDFRARHSSPWRLTDLGIKQAEATGAWLREQYPQGFDRYMVSEYLRAMETAGHLQIPDATWFASFYLRERFRGDMDVKTYRELEEFFSSSMEDRRREPFYWKPVNGESMADLCLRIERVLNTLHWECSEKRVAIVCHGEVMWAFRICIERMSQERFFALDVSDHPHDRIQNCGILQYTRQDPVSGAIVPYANWMRSICPHDMSLSSNEWVGIERPRYSDQDLLDLVAKTPRMIEG